MAHVEFEAKASELREAIDLVKTSTGNALQSLQGASLSTVNIIDPPTLMDLHTNPYITLDTG